MLDTGIAYTHPRLQGTSAEELCIRSCHALSLIQSCTECMFAVLLLQKELSNSLLRTNCLWFMMRNASQSVSQSEIY